MHLPPWFEDDAAFARYLADFLAQEIARLRLGQPLPAGALRAAGDFTAPPLGLTPEERGKMAAALAHALELPPGGPNTTEGFATLAESLRHALRSNHTAITFLTSGSTGIPKPCRQTLARLDEETAFLAGLLRGAKRIVALVPAHHIYGWLFSLRLPQTLGLPVWDARGQRPDKLGRALRAHDAVIGYPDIWSQVLRRRQEIPPGATAISSTAPCPPEIAQAAQAAGFTRFIEIYGSSETSGIGWRDDWAAPFALMPQWRRGDEEDAIRHNATGEDFALPDRALWPDDRHLRILGRRDGALQIGGVNVFPDRIAAVIMAHPAVALALVRPMAGPHGPRLKAFVVPKEAGDEAALRAALTAWMRERLQPVERPRMLSLGLTPPRNAMGKAADWPADERADALDYAAAL